MSETTRPFLTIVSGAPRSGTSLMMRMLEAGGIPPLTDAIRAADRDNPNGYYEFEPVKKLREDTSWVAGSVGKAVKMVYVLLRDLPPGTEYRVLLMRRRLEEVVASQNKMLERLGRPSAGLSEQRMIDMFRAQLDETERWLTGRPGFSHMVVDYNALVADPLTHVPALDAFLGGGLDCAAMCTTVDPDLYRNRA